MKPNFHFKQENLLHIISCLYFNKGFLFFFNKTRRSRPTRLIIGLVLMRCSFIPLNFSPFLDFKYSDNISILNSQASRNVSFPESIISLFNNRSQTREDPSCRLCVRVPPIISTYFVKKFFS